MLKNPHRSGRAANAVRSCGRLSLLVLLLAALADVPPSQAGIREDFEPPQTKGWWGRGSFRWLAFFAIKDVGYDSNIFLDPDSGNPKSDLTATLSPSLRGALRMGGRGFVTFKSQLDYVHFQRFSGQSHANFLASVKGNLNFGSLRLFAATGYRTYDERPSNEIDERTRVLHRSLRGGVAYEISPKTTAEFLASREQIHYTDRDFLYRPACREDRLPSSAGCPDYTLDDLLGRVETQAALRYTQRIMGRTLVHLETQARRHKFTGPIPDPSLYAEPPVLGAARDAEETRVIAGVELDRGGFLHGSARLGLADFRPEVLREQRTRQVLGEVDLHWRVGERLSVQTGYDEDLFFSVFGSNGYYEQLRTEVKCTLYLNQSLGFEASHEAFRLDYPAAEIDEPILRGNRRRDRIRFLRGGLRVKLQARSVMTLGVSWRQRESNLAGLDDRQVLITGGAETTW